MASGQDTARPGEEDPGGGALASRSAEARRAAFMLIRTPVPEHPCSAWSEHAADLAHDMERMLVRFPVSPATDAMILRGELVPVVPGVQLPPDLTLHAPLRAVLVGCAVGPALRHHHVVGAATALWVAVGGRPPRPLDLVTTARPSSLCGVMVRQAPVGPEDVEMVGGAPVVVPSRAALDVLRFLPDRALSLITAALMSGHLDPREVDLRLQTIDGHPHARRARERWERLRPGRAVTGPPPHRDRETAHRPLAGLLPSPPPSGTLPPLVRRRDQQEVAPG
ncbi:hypothetical protein JSY14_12175 [Brachybacterium sp. EF45031]|uniref:hypothetical protein n=1 Tax=Brachybacterium sillae TaxID=2810536 RepID=UPI00217D79F1|nr:hypothetical protein [Brachybacterium sillae]MCS6712728.1 hypothetical protein [Brachybacterium sillae]